MELYLASFVIGMFVGAYLWKQGFRTSVHGAIGKFMDWLSNKEDKKDAKK
jgi:hypothetical protein